MFFTPTAEWTALGQDVLAQVQAAFGAQGLAAGKMSLVVCAPSSFGAAGFAHRAGAAYFPAGLTAPFHMVHGLAALQSGRIEAHPDLDRALREMVLWPSDSAANYVIDCLTGTTGDTALDGAEFLDWASKRGRLDTFYWQQGWPEWDGCRIAQKQGCDLRYGREARLVGPYGEGLNQMNAGCAARLMWELFEGDVPLKDDGLRRAQSYMQRDGTSPEAVFPNFGLAEFLGAGLPKGVKLWSKSAQTGWTGDAKTSWIKHDMLRVSARGMRPLYMVLMAQSRAIAEAGPALFGEVGRMIWDHCQPVLRVQGGGKADQI